MLRLRASIPGDARLARDLEAIPGVRRVTTTPGADGRPVLEADLDPEAAETVIARLRRAGVGEEDFALVRQELLSADPAHRHEGPLWLDVLSEARGGARTTPRYLSLMAVAGLLAALGVIDRNAILIVGAMAASPDLFPVFALAVGLAARGTGLAGHAVLTLVAGLVLATFVAAVLTALLGLFGGLPEHFVVGSGGLGVLARVDHFTVLIALVAGVAAMLSFETRASAAVGVAISVTTIPASAYLGVAAGVREGGSALGAVEVLAVNVLMLLVGATATLVVQSRFGQDRRPPSGRGPRIIRGDSGPRRSASAAARRSRGRSRGRS